jgi:hypothetical protein
LNPILNQFPPLLVFSPATSWSNLIPSKFVGENTNKGSKETAFHTKIIPQYKKTAVLCKTT